MAQNRIASGDSILIAIPAGGCNSGGSVPSNSTIATPGLPILLGNDIVGVPESSFAAGTAGNMVLLLEGAYGNMTLKTGDAPAVGDKLYLDTADGYLTVTSSGNVWAGWCYTAPVVVNSINTCGLLLKKG
jgi:hypothetical protein